MNEILTDIRHALSFVADGGVNQKWYAQHDCAISRDERKKRIIYPDGIQLGDGATANFYHPENFVVLECIDRLLRKGYALPLKRSGLWDVREQRISEFKKKMLRRMERKRQF